MPCLKARMTCRADRALSLAFLLLLIPAAAGAQSLAGAREWLPPGSLSLDALSLHPEEAQEGGRQQSFYAEYGRLAFRSPMILGGTARKAGLSCQTCHPNGHANTDFFIPGLSDAHGRIDITHAFWNIRGENHRDDPQTIPTLRGVKTKERFGHDGRSSSLRDFTRRVIVTEFAGAEPDPILLDALVAYMETLPPVTPRDRPVRLEGDLADIGRHLGTLAVPLAEEDAGLSDRVATMIRGQLGFIYERLDGDGLAEVRDIVTGWSRELQAIAELGAAGQWRTARDRLAALQATVAAPPAKLAGAGPLSLYNPVRLQAWLAQGGSASQ